jgi:transcriptional regulator with XRE-family HTH domain
MSYYLCYHIFYMITVNTSDHIEQTLSPSQSKAARALLAWNQQELAQRAQIGVSTVADFERGKRIPTSNNIEAMTAAFASAGISFVNGGVQGPARTSSSGGTTSATTTTRLIEATDLHQWAARNDAKQYFPQLIERLIQATTNYGAKRLLFRSGDSVQQAGWDGICVQDVNVVSAWLPAGSSGWELGVQARGIKKKANDDYEKRVDDPGGFDPLETTFVFATPQRWQQGAQWAREKWAENGWKKVVVLDADELIGWIDLYPQVQYWLASRLGKIVPGTTSLSDFWLQWRQSTERPMTPALVFGDRDEDGTKLLKWLRDAPAVFALQGDSPQEAMAFLYAALDRLPAEHAQRQISRCIIATTTEAATALGKSPTPLVIVMEASDPGLATELKSQGHHVFVVHGSHVGTSDLVNTLTRPPYEAFKDALTEMGFDEDRATVLTRDTARKIVILRRLIPSAAGKLEPEWAVKDRGKLLIPALLAGAWDSSYEGDRRVMEKLSGEPWKTFEARCPGWIFIPDAPLRNAGTTWKLAAPFDAWFRLVHLVSQSELDHFVEVAKEMLGETDPRFEMDSRERWYAGVRGKFPQYSAWLKSGITETLLLLSMYGAQLPAVPSASQYADHLVAGLLNGAGKSRWWSLSSELRTLAEVSPEAFMSAVENSLEQTDPPVLELFKEDAGPVMGRAYHANLLWALETLAWSTDYLARVSEILARLSTLAPKGTLGNRPEKSLRSIFLMWLPQTNATLEQRLKVIDRLLRTVPDAAWNLMIDILPKSMDSGSYNPKPKWRDFPPGEPQDRTYALIDRGTRALTDRLIANAGADPKRWVELIQHLGSVPLDIRTAAFSKLSAAEAEISDDQVRNEIWNGLRKFISHHRSFPDTDWALPSEEVDRIESIYEQFRPSDPVLQRSWLFQNGVPLLDGRNAENWDQRDKEVFDLRKQAMRELLADEGISAVSRLVQLAAAPYPVGFAYGTVSTSPREAEQTLLTVLGTDSPGTRDFARGLVSSLYVREKQDEWAKHILKEAVSASLPEEAMVELLLALPSIRATWDSAAALGTQINAAYWKEAIFYNNKEAPTDTLYGIDQMLDADRAPEVVERIASDAPTVSSRTIVEVLRAAAEDPWPTGGNAAVMFQWGVTRLLQRLEIEGTVADEEIAPLEWRLLPVLEHSERQPKTLHRFISTVPEFFLQVLSVVYRPLSKATSTESPSPTEKEKAIASQAWRLLESWRQIPGSLGIDLDSQVLTAWVEKAHRLAVEAERGAIADEYIGKMLSSAPADTDGIWPHSAVRDVIENMRNAHLETGIIVGVRNGRGVTMRGMQDGGELERNVASRYNKWAEATKLDYPRTSAMLREIARSYENTARTFDEQAERNDWEY